MKSFCVFSAIGRLDTVGKFLFLGAIGVARVAVRRSFLIQCDSDFDEGFNGMVLAHYCRSAVMRIEI